MNTHALATATLALASACAAAPTEVQLSGQITSGQNLTFAVINGNLLASNPAPADLPIPYNATLLIDEQAQTATFEFGGSFASPNRAYTFDVPVDGLGVGLSAFDEQQIQIVDVFNGFSFTLEIDLQDGTGSWSWFEAGTVPAQPVGDSGASATVTSVTVIPPTDAPCDADQNGTLDIGDLLTFLTSWFVENGAGPGVSDFNTDGTVTIGDLLDFLVCWFDGV